MIRRRPWDPYAAPEPTRIPRLAAGPPADEPITVGAIVDRYPPFVNAGAEWMLHAMLRHLVRAGHRAIVATEVDDVHDVEGVEVWPVRRAAEVGRLADVLVGHLYWTPLVVETADANATPLLYIVHNDAQLSHWKLTPDDLTAVVWNALWMREAHPRWGGPSTVVRPPVLLDDYRLGRNPAEAEFVTLVNPNPDKGAEVFYELARRRPDLRFATVDGGYGQQLRPKGLGNVERLPATGAIAEDVYARTRVLCVPSRYESWGRVAVEAMCSGIPVIAHPTPGLVEALGPAGIYADRDDPDAWAEALALLDDPGAYAVWSQAALDRAVHLDEQARTDLARWERLCCTAATLGPRLRVMPTDHDPFAGHADAHRTEPAPAEVEAAVTNHAVTVDLSSYEPDADGLVRVDLSDSADPDALRSWANADPIGVGDRIRFHALDDEATWREGAVVEVSTVDANEVAVVVIDGTSAEADDARERLRAAFAETGAQEPAPASPSPTPPEPAAGPENAIPGAVADDSAVAVEVPTKAADVVAWIAAVEGDEAQARREAAWATETARPEGVRKTVAEVAEPI